MLKRFAYLLKVKFYDIESKYYNHFISESKCEDIYKGEHDNGRIIKAKELDTHNFSKYEILDSYYATYDYLPKTFINFILEYYEYKTKYKGIEEYEDLYRKSKAYVNALYGMCCTNMIRDEVIFDNKLGFQEIPIDNETIEDLLIKEKQKAFLSFSWRCLGYRICEK